MAVAGRACIFPLAKKARGAKEVLNIKRYLRRERVAISHNSERKSAGRACYNHLNHARRA